MLKIKRRNLFEKFLLICLLVVFILEYHIFYLVDYPSWLSILENNQMNIVVAIFGFFISLVCYGEYSKLNARIYNRLMRFSFLSLISWFMIFIFSIIMYPNQSIRLSMGFHITFLYAFWAVPIYTLFKIEKNDESIFYLMNVFAVIWYVLLIIQHLVYLSSGVLILNAQDLFTGGEVTVRDYGIRISIKAFGAAMILYNFYVFSSGKEKNNLFKRILSLIFFILGMVSLILVTQTRALTFAVLISIGIILLISHKKNTKIIAVVVVIAVIAILGYLGILNNFFISFSTTSTNSKRLGTSIRIDAIKYYFSCFINNPIFGNGFAADNYMSIEHGTSGQFYYTDVGVFGLLGEVGLFSIVFYIYPVARLIKIAIKVIKFKQGNKFSFYIGLITFLLLTSFSLIVTDKGRVLLFPIIIAYGEFVYEKLNQQIRSKKRLRQNKVKGI